MDDLVEKSCWGVAIRATFGLVALISLLYLTIGF